MRHIYSFTLAAFLSACATQQHERMLAPAKKDLSAPVENGDEIVLPLQSYYLLWQRPVAVSSLEEGVTLIAKDKAWHDLYHFLHKLTTSSEYQSVKIEPNDHQQKYIRLYEAWTPELQAQELKFLYRLVPTTRQTTHSLSRADLLYLGEVHGALHTYVNTGKLPKLRYDVKTIIDLKYRAPRSSQNP